MTQLTRTSRRAGMAIRAIEIGGYRLGARTAEPVFEPPTLSGWQAAFDFATHAVEASPYWVGDLLRDAENRVAWREKLDQAMAVTGLAEKTLHNLTSISRHVAEAERDIAPSLKHAGTVSALPQPAQAKWLDKARTEGWTAAELAAQLRATSRRKVIEGQAVLTGRFRVVCINPDWRTQTVEQVKRWPVAAHIMTHAVVFLWAPASALPDAVAVLPVWDLTYRTNIVWDMVLGAGGTYADVSHQHLLVATRGDAYPPEDPAARVDSVQVVRRHDFIEAKPVEFVTLIERLYPRTGSKLWIGGAGARDGWAVVGNSPDHWAADLRAAAQAEPQRTTA